MSTNEKSEKEASGKDHRRDVEYIVKESYALMAKLLGESERAAVVLGAARLELALENALKRILSHNPGGDDNLFDIDRPLGTLAAKVALSYRLGLVDSSFEHSLQMLRRIRNDFAHSSGTETLENQPHRDRIREMVICAGKDTIWGTLRPRLDDAKKSPIVADFATVLAIMLARLELNHVFNEQVKIREVVSFE
jgi:hypothetical protein